MVVPTTIPNLVGGQAVPAASGRWIEKLRPVDETLLCRVARSNAEDVAKAVAAARAAQAGWAERTAVERGDIVRELASRLRDRRDEASAIVAERRESRWSSRGETEAAIEMGFFVAAGPSFLQADDDGKHAA